jgi:hypothetical protein
MRAHMPKRDLVKARQQNHIGERQMKASPKVARGTARAQRRVGMVKKGSKPADVAGTMAPPSATALAAQVADTKRANRKLGIKLYNKAGAGIA